MRERSRGSRANSRGFGWMLVAGLSVALTGCSDFFLPLTSTSSTSGAGTGDFVYVGNAQTDTVSGFAVGTGTLTAVPNTPYNVGFSPTAMVVHPNNTFLYVAGASAIFLYTISSTGALTASSSGAGVAVATVLAMDISPDGKWLFALDGTTTVVDEYEINQTTGALTVLTPVAYSVTNAVVVPKSIRVAPSGALVFAALGTGGDVIFTLNTTTGALASAAQLSLGSTTTSDNALAVDSLSAYLYIARSGTNGGTAVYAIGTGGALNEVVGSPFMAGAQPYSLVIDSSGKYVYVANGSDGTISGYTIGTGGVLTALSGSPYTSGSQVEAIGRDNSGKYILAAAYGGSPDLTMYSFDTATPGKLDTSTSAASGTDPAHSIAIALTH